MVKERVFEMLFELRRFNRVLNNTVQNEVMKVEFGLENGIATVG